jgi:hypothetical protein
VAVVPSPSLKPNNKNKDKIIEMLIVRSCTKVVDGECGAVAVVVADVPQLEDLAIEEVQAGDLELGQVTHHQVSGVGLELDEHHAITVVWVGLGVKNEAED